MAIAHVGSASVSNEGPFPALNELQVPYPSGLSSGDILHVVAFITRPKWYAARGASVEQARAYSFMAPPGWNIVYSDGPLLRAHYPRALVLRKIATGLETGTLTLPITEVNNRPDVPQDPLEILMVTAGMTAHSGASPFLFGGPFTRGMWGVESVTLGGGGGGGTVTANNNYPRAHYPNSTILQFALFTQWEKLTPGQKPPSIPDPLTPAPTPGYGTPAWDVLTQAGNFTTRMSVGPTPPLPDPVGQNIRNVGSRLGILETTNPIVNEQQLYGDPPFIDVFDPAPVGISIVLVDSSFGGVDPPPAPGQPGVTGSGWVLPEWTGRNHEISTPLATSVWVEGPDEYGMPDLIMALDEFEGPRPVGLEVTFNGLGAITSGVATFAAATGLVPYQHYLGFHLRTPDLGENDPSVAWAGGLVKNVRQEAGLWEVELTGLWALLNDARVSIDSMDIVERPAHPAFTGTLVLGIGDPTAAVLEAAQDWQRTWGEYLNTVFRDGGTAAWGVGPDRVYVQGLPEQGGVLDLNTSHDAIASLEAGEFILPPYVTEWWAEDANGDILSGTLNPPLGLLSPARIIMSRVDLGGTLLMPPEAFLPSVAGPSHALAFAGIAVPPLRISDLPGGATQMVASARVRITVGEEGNMPNITTLLTTVALPYEAS